jgi:hypothetical protein
MLTPEEGARLDAHSQGGSEAWCSIPRRERGLMLTPQEGARLDAHPKEEASWGRMTESSREIDYERRSRVAS